VVGIDGGGGIAFGGGGGVRKEMGTWCFLLNFFYEHSKKIKHE
jgi:hypothetical protein